MYAFTMKQCFSVLPLTGTKAAIHRPHRAGDSFVGENIRRCSQILERGLLNSCLEISFGREGGGHKKRVLSTLCLLLIMLIILDEVVYDQAACNFV